VNTKIEHAVDDAHKIFVQVISGEIVVNGQAVSAGDGLQITGEGKLDISSKSEAEFLVFDMA
jgi:redox-sensitive bicupin YhaK (pirin superfamily)